MLTHGRRRAAAILGAIALGALTLSACGSADTTGLEADVQSLRDDVLELRQQVEALQAGTTTEAPATAIMTFTDYGFTLPVPEGLELQVAGIGGAEASADAGQLTASAGGVTMVLIWTSGDLTAGQAVQGAFEVLQASSADLDFRPLNEGDLEVDGQVGSFGAFAAEDGDTVLGIGLIGGWTCGAAPTYSITVIGRDLEPVQSSFEGFTSGFACSS
jgi:outer membrane murein-binding lipoprotein Lpp